jgi:hypothetical protein
MISLAAVTTACELRRDPRDARENQKPLTVSHVTLVDLTIGLDNAETVADRVGGDGRDEADECLALRCDVSPPPQASMTHEELLYDCVGLR